MISCFSDLELQDDMDDIATCPSILAHQSDKVDHVAISGLFHSAGLPGDVKAKPIPRRIDPAALQDPVSIHHYTEILARIVAKVLAKILI